MKDAAGRMLAIVNDRMMGLPIPTWLPTAKTQLPRPRKLATGHRIADCRRRAMDEATWPDDLLSRMMPARRDRRSDERAAAARRDP